MLSSVATHWTVFVVVILRCGGVHSLTVEVSPVVFTDLKATKLTLPCEYVLENPDQTCNIRWEKSGDTVIVKDTVGQIFVGHRYRNRALWGDECSLILRYPTLSDTGRYTITAFAAHINYTVSAVTEVTVSPEDKSSGETTTEICPVTSVSQSVDTNTVAAEDGYTSPVWVTAIPVTALAIIVLVAHVVLIRWSQRRGFTVCKHRLLLGGVLVVFTIGVKTGIVGMALRNTVVTVVGQYFVYLGFISHVSCDFCFMKTKASISRQSTGSLLNDDVSTANKVIPTAE